MIRLKAQFLFACALIFGLTSSTPVSNTCTTDIQEAASGGNVETLAALLDGGESIDCIGVWGQSLLIKAIQRGHSQAAIYLINRGINPDLPDDLNGYAIHRAARGGLIDVFNLLAKQSNLNLKDGGGKTPLMWAANSEHFCLVKIIVEKGGWVNDQDSSGYTALSLTSSPDVAKYLLMQGANADLRDFRGLNAIEGARFQKDDAMGYNEDLADDYQSIIELLKKSR